MKKHLLFVFLICLALNWHIKDTLDTQKNLSSSTVHTNKLSMFASKVSNEIRKPITPISVQSKEPQRLKAPQKSTTLK